MATLGCFVVIEGPEGAGKSTLAHTLEATLQRMDVDVCLFREPGGTLLGEMARKAVLDPTFDPGPESELFLMLTARADLVTKILRPQLARGFVVICDRYELSTFAYQVAGRGLDEAKVRAANALATGGLVPDVTLVLDVDPEVSLERQEARGRAPDRMEQAKAGFHARVNAAYRAAQGPGIVHIDGSAPQAAVADEAWRVLKSFRSDLFA